MKVLLKKALACLLYLLFVQALLVSDFALVRKGGAGESGPCVLSFDVCGHGHSTGAFDGADFTAALPVSEHFIPSFSTDFPPNPDEAVATAEPGETGKPPKA